MIVYKPRGSFFLLQLRSTPVEVLHDNTNKHVEHEESNKEEKWDEVQQPPLIVILFRLNISLKAVASYYNSPVCQYPQHPVHDTWCQPTHP